MSIWRSGLGDDVVRTRQAVRALALQAGFSLVDQTKIITAASEIARNTLDYGGGGELYARAPARRRPARPAAHLHRSGPGISDIEQALKDGYSTGNGLGLGLSGAKRLSNEFAIDSRPGAGTKITLARWK